MKLEDCHRNPNGKRQQAVWQILLLQLHVLSFLTLFHGTSWLSFLIDWLDFTGIYVLFLQTRLLTVFPIYLFFLI